MTVNDKWRCRRCIGEDGVIQIYAWNIVWYGQFLTNWCDFIKIRIQRFAVRVPFWIGLNLFNDDTRPSQWVLMLHASHTPQTDELSLVLWSTVSQNLRPLGAARTMWVYFTFCQQSTPKSLNSGSVLYWRFWPNWWLEKIRVGNSPKSGCVLY